MMQCTALTIWYGTRPHRTEFRHAWKPVFERKSNEYKANHALAYKGTLRWPQKRKISTKLRNVHEDTVSPLTPPQYMALILTFADGPAGQSCLEFELLAV